MDEKDMTFVDGACQLLINEPLLQFGMNDRFYSGPTTLLIAKAHKSLLRQCRACRHRQHESDENPIRPFAQTPAHIVAFLVDVSTTFACVTSTCGALLVAS